MRQRRRAEDMAILGGNPAFDRLIPVGQLYFPAWDRYEEDMRSIFERGWFADGGPLARRFEEELARFFGVRHAIAVTNATFGLSLVAKALGISGGVVLPAWTFIATAQSMTWAGLTPILADVDPSTQMIGTEEIDQAIANAKGEHRVGAILAVNLWGGAASPKRIEKYADDMGVPLFFDSAQAVGCISEDGKLGGFGRAEVFSLHATKILSSAEGGVITTNDDDLAAKCRNISSSCGDETPTAIPLTASGCFTEAQAAVGLANLEQFDDHVMRNRMTRDVYRAILSDLQGFRLLEHSGVVASNDSYINCIVDENELGLNAAMLTQVLHAEAVVSRRYFNPGIHRSTPYAHSPSLVNGQGGYPNTDALSMGVIQLPVGALAGPEEAEVIGELILAACRFSIRIRQRLA